jgi:hypothetical protein
MMKTSAPKAVIRLQTIGASVRPNCDHTGAFLDVTFKCTLAPLKEDPRGFGISFPKSEIASVEQLVEHSQVDIRKLLKRQQRSKRRTR